MFIYINVSIYEEDFNLMSYEFVVPQDDVRWDRELWGLKIGKSIMYSIRYR